MQVLMIQDDLRWHERWSSEIGRRLKVKDSTHHMFVFDEQHTREDILTVLSGVPAELYRLVEVEDAREENCELLADSGKCYKKLH
jgi:hypothetical protein